MFEAAERKVTRPKIFISYARSDVRTIAEELVPGLEVAGFEAYLEKHDMENGKSALAR